MRDALYKLIHPIKKRKGFWWKNVLQWSKIVSDCFDEIQQLTADLSQLREAFRAEQAKSERLSSLAVESRVLASDTSNKLSDEKSKCRGLVDELAVLKSDFDKARYSIDALESRALHSELESQKTKAELSKMQMDLTRSELENQKQKLKLDEANRVIMLMRRFEHEANRLDSPPKNGIRGMFAAGKRLSALLILLVPMFCSAQFPPPFWRNAWTTNVPPRAVTGQDNLSVTNLGSTTNWQFFNVGPKTVARLVDVTNIASSFGGDAGGTNARQFGSLNLTNWSNIPTGSMANVVSTDFLTNWANSISNLTQTKQNGSAVLTNLVGTVANNVTNVVSLSTTNATSKPITNAYASGVLTLFGLEAGANISLGQNGSNITITGTASAGDAGGTNSRQFGTALLTNLSNNPYTGYTNQVFGGTNISVRTAGGTNFIDTTGHLNNWAQIPTGAMANVVATDFLTNWANAVSNLTSTKQFGTALLTNLSNNPYTGYTNIGFFSITNQAWVEMNGSDSTGTFGDRTKPFLSIQAAVSNTLVEVNPPWIINVGVGSFTNGDRALVISNGCWIRGAGMDSTEISANFPLTTNGAAVYVKDNGRLYDLTINQLWTNDLAAPIGSYGSFAINPQGTFTNVYTARCRFLGKSDNLYVSVTTGACSITND
jgi:hypothetical protein